MKDCNSDEIRFCENSKPVHVNAYLRFRFGRVEFVREHFRAGRNSHK